MHAVLTLAASHCRFLDHSVPSVRYCELECLHRSYALSGLRYALATAVNQENFDPLFACSLLLSFHTWSFIDTTKVDEINFAVDGVLVLTQGMRDLVLQARKQRIHSVFGDFLNRNFEIPEQQISYLELQDLCYPLNSERTDNTYAGAAVSLMSFSVAFKQTLLEIRGAIYFPGQPAVQKSI